MKKLLIIMLAMLIALFFVACQPQVEQYTLTVNTSGTGTVALNPDGGTYEAGTVVTLTANPDTNYTFTSWSGDLSGSTNPTTITIDSNKAVTATFTQKAVATPTFNPNGGTFSSSQSVTISCATSGATIKYTTNGSTPSQTVGTTYTGAIILTSTTTLKAIAYKAGMSNSQVATATFTKNATQYTLTVTFTNGTVTANGTLLTSGVAATYDDGTSISLQATPSTGYDFTSWSGSLTGSTNPSTFTMNGNKSITATFTATSGADIDADGKVNTLGVWLPCKWNLTTSSMLHTYYFNSIIGQTYKVAIDDNNTGFWTPATTGNPTPTADTDHQVTKINGTSYTYVSPSGSGWKDSDYSSTDYITVVATENQIKFQVRPYNNGTSYVGNYFLKVVQVLPQYTLTVNSTGNGSVTLNPAGGTYDQGTVVTLTAVPNGSDTFTSWSGDLSGSTNPTTITMNTNKTVTATFTGTTPQNEWLMMMYMGGDCNLESALWGDVNEMEKGLYDLNSTVRAKTKIVVLWDGDSTDDTKLYELGPDSTQNSTLGSSTIDKTSTKWWTGSELDMGSGTNVTAFLNWANTQYPNYTKSMLMLSNHGGGPGKGTLPSKGIVYDDHGGYLDTNELANAIDASTPYSSTNKLTILGMDACLMGNIEEAYEYRNIAQYFVASPESEQGDGWEYDTILPDLTLGMTGSALSIIIAQDYASHFSGDQTMSAVDLSQISALKTAVDALGTAISSAGSSAMSAAKSILNSCHEYGDGYFPYLHEFGEFCIDLNASTNANITTAIKNAAVAAGTALGNAVLWAYGPAGNGGTPSYSGTGTSHKRGLSIVDDYQSFYSTLDFNSGGWATLISNSSW